MIPSDDSLIPSPYVITEGTNTNVVAGELVDSAGLFSDLNVQVGDVVYNTTTSTSATVISVTSNNVIVLNADIFLASGDAYIIYQNSAMSGYYNGGCNLYIGGTGAVTVITLGQDVVTFSAVPAGTVLPIQVVGVKSTASGTTATLIRALW